MTVVSNLCCEALLASYAIGGEQCYSFVDSTPIRAGELVSQVA
jgi:hypothetical protein